MGEKDIRVNTRTLPYDVEAMRFDKRLGYNALSIIRWRKAIPAHTLKQQIKQNLEECRRHYE